MEDRGISRAVIRRLPRYYRYLGELLENGVERISSGDLSKRMKVTASQIRQDLNNFGGFGQQGYGYNVPYLYAEIGKILGLDRSVGGCSNNCCCENLRMRKLFHKWWRCFWKMMLGIFSGWEKNMQLCLVSLSIFVLNPILKQIKNLENRRLLEKSLFLYLRGKTLSKAY